MINQLDRNIAIEITEEQKSRIKADWEKIAGEELVINAQTRIEPVYARGSELACLRLLNNYHRSGCSSAKAKVKYYEHNDTWTFILQP